MIEATCAACGTLNRVSETSVPVGAKFVTCSGCKARVAIGAPTAQGLVHPPAIPKVPAAGAPADLELADLPAPKRASALGGESPRPAAKPAPPARLPARSGLAAALDPDLPAPKPTRTTAAMRAMPMPALDLDERFAQIPPLLRDDADTIDLPAPKWSTTQRSDSAALPRPAEPGSSTTPRSDSTALPRPAEPGSSTTPRSDSTALPRPAEPGSSTARAAAEPARDDLRDITDLPAPKLDRGVIDLPTPKRTIKRSVPDMPPAKPPPPPVADLPAPKRGPNIPDVPTPRSTGTITAVSTPGAFFDDLADGPSGGNAPAGASRTTTAVGAAADESIGLPAPKGFFDDLPGLQGAHTPDLPAPKGFFDDLPQVKSNPSTAGATDLPAPKGFFDDLPQPALRQRPELPAPKGFFDDLPQVKSNPSGAGGPDLPAPKGYFEDVPGLPLTSKPELPAPQGFFDDIPGLPLKSKPEVPAPKGHFENVPGRPNKKSDELAPKGFFDDLPARGPAGPASEPPRPGELELDSGPELELEAPSGNTPTFDELELSKPSDATVRFAPPARAAAPITTSAEPSPHYAGDELELEGASRETDLQRTIAKRPARPAPPVEDAAVAGARARRKKLVLGGVLAAIALGGGGVVLFQRHVAAQQRADAIAAQLAVARSSYTASDAGHWQRAALAARSVIELDGKNPEALGIGAESLLASALGDGVAAPAKLAQARGLLDAANTAGISSPQLGRARALSVLAAHQPDAALAQLQPLAAAAPTDPLLALYLGWTLHAKGEAQAAIASYDLAAGAPPTRIAALYGRGNARLELADLDGARGDFSAVLELAKDHIGAQVGLAAAQPPSAAQQEEADLLAILSRKDIATADPRVVARAWALAGAAAARAGRTSVARERYRKALAVVPQDLAATTGLAETELADGKITTAADLIATALNVAKDNVAAQLVQSEIEIKQDKLPLAAQRLGALAGQAASLPALEQARLHLITGKLLEAQGKDAEALESFILGAKAARDLDLAPLMAAVGKLAAMVAAAVDAKDASRADELRARSDQLLGELAEHAERDPRLAMTLGMAYLQEGDATKAESWLRRVVAARPTDPDARYQLGRAQLKAGKNGDALDSLRTALGQDPARSDIGVELARAYEALGRDAEAGTLYTKLLAGKDPSLELRARAGRYFARTGMLDKAGEQGARIVASDPHSAAGLYLLGEGLLAAGKRLEAKQAFQRALDVDHDAVYYDALGRAAEALSQGGDREAQDLALRSYQSAIEAEPATLSALAGEGRLYVARHEAAKAVPPLLAAARLDAKNAEVMFLLGAAYQELQQSAIALQWLEASVHVSPRAEAYWRIGQLHRDVNQGAQAAEALDSATRLGAESEKRSGQPVGWLTEALYLQGRVHFDLHNEARARDAWMTYVARNPPASARLTEVQQLLATTLRPR